jgi:uncharacterized RDD family membrane protein YckC
MHEESTTGAPGGLPRRLAALLYDVLLSIALAFVATFTLLPLSGGEAILSSKQGLAGHFYHALLFLLLFGYFGLCWTRGGQTLGMRAWRIRLQAADGRRLNWADALVRFTIGAAFTLMAVAGSVYLLQAGRWPGGLVGGLLLLPAVANFAWIAYDGRARSLQDLAGRMCVTRLG